jgi:hypothetical protein
MNSKAQLAEKLTCTPKRTNALIGFDGFVDEIIHVVDKRSDPEHYTRIQTIEEYCARILAGSGLSCNIELISVQQKLGGNGPIFANALKKYDIDITYMGAVGLSAHHPVFDELADGSEMIGLEEPGHTDAYEFYDGKIIASKIEHFRNITWDKIIKTVGFERFLSFFETADLLGFENWTMLPHMSEIWSSLLLKVIPAMKSRPSDKVMFFDLADPEKRSAQDIKNALTLIGQFTGLGFQTVLGLNKKEACEIAELFGHKIEEYKSYPLEPLCRFLYEKLSLSCLVIHPVDRACCMHGEIYTEIKGPYCEHPALTTGAGDTFNAGFMLGWTNGFEMEECLLCAAGASGFYVRSAKSPSAHELADFLINWK